MFSTKPTKKEGMKTKKNELKKKNVRKTKQKNESITVYIMLAQFALSISKKSKNSTEKAKLPNEKKSGHFFGLFLGKKEKRQKKDGEKGGKTKTKNEKKEES